MWSWGCCKRLLWIQNQMNTADMSWNVMKPVTKLTASFAQLQPLPAPPELLQEPARLPTWKSPEGLEGCRNGIKVKVKPKPTIRKSSIDFNSFLNGFLWSLHSFWSLQQESQDESSPPPFLAQRLWQHHRTRSLPWPFSQQGVDKSNTTKPFWREHCCPVSHLHGLSLCMV